MKPQREKGFYWVKIDDEWEIARWWSDEDDILGGWYFTGHELAYKDSSMAEIGPKVERPK